MGKYYVKTAAAACLIMSAMIAGTVSLGFFMDPVTTDLGFDRSSFSLYFSLITIVGTLTLPIYGKLIAKVGTRKLVIIGGLWTGLAIAALALCHDLPSFYFVGCLIGLGFFGCSYAVVPVIVSAWFVEKNGLVMGLAAACGGTVAMLLSLVFPSVIASQGWEAGYIMLGVVVFALTTPVGIFLLRSTPREVGLEPFGAKSRTAVTTNELRGISYKEALKMPQLWAIVVAFVLFAITVTVTQHLAAYFVSVGFSPVEAGLFMSVISAGIIATNTAAGIISDKLGLMKTVAACSLLYLISFLVLPATSTLPVICIALVCMSLGNANTSLFAPMMTGVVFGTKDYASIWGLVSMACVLGQAIGAPLWGLVYDSTGGYEWGMYASAIIAAAAFALLYGASKSAKQAHHSR